MTDTFIKRIEQLVRERALIKLRYLGYHVHCLDSMEENEQEDFAEWLFKQYTNDKDGV